MAATPSLPDPPIQLKAIQSYMKIAQDVERIDPVVSYWVRLFSTETALKIDRDSPECKKFLSVLIEWLEKFKTTHKENEAVSNQTVGQAHFENFAMTLFNKADTLDRGGTANKNTVRMFFMAAVLFEAMSVFGPLTEEITQKAKYAKFKAAYIQKCLKAGQTPKPGPIDGSDLEGTGDNSSDAAGNSAGTSEQPSDALDIPEVPKDSPRDDSQPRPQDPFILNPSLPPSYLKPSQPPSSPQVSKNDPIQPSKPQPSPAKDWGGTPIANKDPPMSTIEATRLYATDGTPLKHEDIIQSQKYCKFANSALQYDDIPTAVDNLQKALKLLTAGQKQG
uniref:Vacuolar protein sorting-associated protein VTA1 n=1 Tax=Aceria tosichella TaxID=561515 RepID=A0A6G1S6H6_9ACAR